MKNILLPTDFSENSINAMRYALQLFRDTRCSFFLVHTFTPAAYHSGKAFNNFTSVELVQANRKAASEEIKAVRDKLIREFNNPNHSFQWSVDFNLLTSKINSMVKNKQIDLILMGTQGATGAREIFLGTQTMYTIKKVKIPVLAVPSGYSFKKPENLLFATDYKILREEDLKLMKFFIRLCSGKLHVLNVFTEQGMEEEQRLNQRKIAEYFEDKKPVFHLTEGNDIPEAVEAFQKKNHIDLIFMVHKKHSFFENILFKPVINQLVYHTSIPFLVIPVRE